MGLRLTGVFMSDVESIYVEKKIVCKRCGHVHEFTIRTTLSINNFQVNAICAACGAKIVIDLDSLFKSAKPQEQLENIPDPYAMDSSSSTSSASTTIDLDAVEGIDEGASDSSSSGSEEPVQPMPDVSSFFDEVEEGK